MSIPFLFLQLVQEQQENVDAIQDQAESARERAKEGEELIRNAHEKQQSSISMLIKVLAGLIVVAGIVVIIFLLSKN